VSRYPLATALVQFPHPGPEHQPAADTTVMSWNTGPHRRKFMTAPGRWHDPDGLHHSGQVAFWGEWEPPSLVADRQTSPPGCPTVLHRPLPPNWTGTGFHQNTDPLVFGGFMYSNCRQERNGRLRSLLPGSIVLFGSMVERAFVLDTCFVIARTSSYTKYGPPSDAERCLHEVIFEPLASDGKPAVNPLTLYQGATVKQPINGTFSFVPAQPYHAGGPWGFPRPAITIPGIAPLRNAQSASTVDCDPEHLAGIWDVVVEQVLDAGLVLAVHIDLPA
jgi:hypothetical protein